VTGQLAGMGSGLGLFDQSPAADAHFGGWRFELCADLRQRHAAEFAQTPAGRFALGVIVVVELLDQPGDFYTLGLRWGLLRGE
jgi:hypothetical protein